MVEEQRKHPRVSAGVSVTCHIADDRSLEGTATDVSMGGMFVEAAESPAFGARVMLTCQLSEKDAPLRFEAVVRWNKPGGFGVQFGLLGARETHALAKFIKQQA